MKKLFILMLAASMALASVPVLADDVDDTADSAETAEITEAVDSAENTADVTEAAEASPTAATAADLSGITFSPWFTEEFANTAIEFELVDKTDYTQSATRLDFAELIYSYLASKGLIGTASQANPFTDTTDAAVNALNEAGIINGVSDTEFAPDSSLTREAAATILARTYYYANPGVIEEGTPEYSDADEISDWAAESVNQLYKLNMMTGTDGKFMPKSELTLEQALAVILRANIESAIIDVDADETTDGTEDDIVEAVNPITEYDTAADLNAALTTVAIGDISDAESYTAAYYAIDGMMAEIVYTSDDTELTIRKAVRTDAAVNDISGVYGAETVDTFEVTDVAKITGEETIEVSLSVYGNMQIACWALDDSDAIYNFSLVIDSETEYDEETIKALVIDIINTTPRD